MSDTMTKVDALLASWPSTMDTQGDADKMQAMVSLARSLQDDITAAEKERDSAYITISETGGRAADYVRRAESAEKRIGELEGERKLRTEVAAGLMERAEAAESRLSALQSVEGVGMREAMVKAINALHLCADSTESWDAGFDCALDMAIEAIRALPINAATEQSQALSDVVAERKRQIEKEGWTLTHDDAHAGGAMALAAACYAVSSLTNANLTHRALGLLWPWAGAWWKPKDPRRDLVRATALLLAEVERRDRANSATTTKGPNEAHS